MKKLAVLLMILILLILPGLASQTDSGYTPEEMLEVWYQVGAMLRENGTYPYVELRYGDTGYEVMALQTRLKELNYYDKEVVPTFGGGTGTAMRLFEKVNKLKVNGWASVEDQQLLFKSVALPNTGTTTQPQTTTGTFQSTFGPLVTLPPQATALILSTPGSGITPMPATPTPATTIGEPITAPPPTPTPAATLGEPVTAPPTATPVITLGPVKTFKLSTPSMSTLGPIITSAIPIVTPHFELTQPEISIPHL